MMQLILPPQPDAAREVGEVPRVLQHRAASTHPRNASAVPAGAFAFALKEVSMFEERPQQEIDALMQSNPEFKKLYQRHKELDKKVLDAELGVLPIDDVTLVRMKREKLATKDRLFRIYEAQRH